MFTGTFPSSNIVHVNRTGGQLWFNGTVDNAGHTLDLNTLGTVRLTGSLSGGTLQSSGTAELVVFGGSAAFEPDARQQCQA